MKTFAVYLEGIYPQKDGNTCRWNTDCLHWQDIARMLAMPVVCEEGLRPTSRPSGIASYNCRYPSEVGYNVSMDFVTKLPKSEQGLSHLGDCGDRLTIFAHFLPKVENDPLDKLARSFQKALGTDISMSTAYHPETDSQSERTFKISRTATQDNPRFNVRPLEGVSKVGNVATGLELPQDEKEFTVDDKHQFVKIRV
ncbi:hypothetical protein Tco_0375869 [Tanacetum coccineum]